MTTITLDERELAAVLAGLRLLARVSDPNMPEWDVATNGGEMMVLTQEETDALCQRINTGRRLGWNGTHVGVGKTVKIHNSEYRLPTGARGQVVSINGTKATVRLTRLPRRVGLDCPWQRGNLVALSVWWLEGDL